MEAGVAEQAEVATEAALAAAARPILLLSITVATLSDSAVPSSAGVLIAKILITGSSFLFHFYFIKCVNKRLKEVSHMPLKNALFILSRKEKLTAKFQVSERRSGGVEDERGCMKAFNQKSIFHAFVSG